jgi:N-acetylglutamate synthase-like GNAT family acetyltransferase
VDGIRADAAQSRLDRGEVASNHVRQSAPLLGVCAEEIATSDYLIAIESFTASHSAAVAALIVSIQREEFEIPVTLADQPDLLDIAGYYQHGAGNFWVALANERVIGTISLLDIGNAQGALRKMFVHSDFRGPRYGVAVSLLDTLLAWSEEQSLLEIFLGTTAKFLAAHRFYEKNGFDEIPKAELPPSFPVMAVDTKFYRRGLGDG